MAQLVDRLQGMAPNYINGRINALQPGDKVEALAPAGTLTVSEALDRLGLKLAEEKRPVPALVIARVQQPSAN